jgi:hypothetical protein
MSYKWFFAWIILVGSTSRLTAQIGANGVIYVNTYKALAIAEEQRSGIPASITLAQGLHESEAGTSELCKRSNNHFGIKCKEDWKGDVVYHDDDSRGECFRSYAAAEDSYRDHSEFLKRSNRYAFLFDLDVTDYEGWAYGLKKAGYATNIKYSQILIKLIKDYNLQQYTLIAIGKLKPSDEVVLTMPGVPSVTAIAATGQPEGQTVSATVRQENRPQPEVSYPEGEFTINKTKVIYAAGGVSLLSIANQYDLPLGRLLEFNDMKEEDVLVKGQLIFLQRKRRTGSIEFHVVRDGETLYDICQAEGIRYQDLLEMNQLAPDARPAAGERIYLQGSAPSRPQLSSNQK